MDMDASLAVAAVERTKPFEISGDAVFGRLEGVDPVRRGGRTRIVHVPHPIVAYPVTRCLQVTSTGAAEFHAIRSEWYASPVNAASGGVAASVILGALAARAVSESDECHKPTGTRVSMPGGHNGGAPAGSEDRDYGRVGRAPASRQFPNTAGHAEKPVCRGHRVA